MVFRNYWYSLRFRYTVGVISLIILIFFGAYLAYSIIHQAQKETAVSLNAHQTISENVRLIRASVLDSYTYTDAYLLEPLYINYKEQALNKILIALSESQGIQQTDHYLYSSEYKVVESLTKLLLEFQTKTVKLFLLREDVSLQYPSMAIGYEVMQPNRNSFNNLMALALNELQEEGKNKTKIYSDFIQARHVWTQVLSNFRLYLANRMGSFDVKALAIQEQSIITLYRKLEKQLQKLSALNELGELGFQASISVEGLVAASSKWFAGFKKVRKINNSDSWRADSKMMKQEIVPLVNSISNMLFEIENHVSTSARRDMGIIVKAANRQTNILLWGAGAVLVFLLIIFISTNHLVFRPIANVIKALKAESFGKEGLILPAVRSKETTALVDAFNEMSQRIHKRQTDLEYQALHDALTALPNRILLQERMEHHLLIARRDQRNVTLFMIDLDRFKEINDTVGHHVGDKVLIEVGFRITTSLREIDTVARLGGDEFAVILPDTTEEQAGKVAEKLSLAMKKIFEIDGLHLNIGMSIGIASYPDHGVDVTTLIQHADVAMYVAKQNQLDYSVYDANTDEYSIVRLELINDLREAIENNDLDLYFQPIINMADDEVKGLETLLRWQHPSLGAIPPEQIVELAEQTALIDQLTYWVVDNALKQMEVLQKIGHNLEVAINISVLNLKDRNFVDTIRNILNKYKIKSKKVVFEITESAMMSNPAHAAELLSELDEMGIKLAVDDFGMGFSSLSYLKQLPVDELKIDKSFVIGMKDNESDEVIVHSTIELAHNLGLEVVAEGVEEKVVYEKLKKYKCDTAQGHYMSMPMPMDKLESWLETFSLSHVNT